MALGFKPRAIEGHAAVRQSIAVHPTNCISRNILQPSRAARETQITKAVATDI
jgi:hypothetical protein